GGAGDAAADEEQCRGEAEAAESEEPIREMCEREKIGIDHGGENKKGDEPGELEAEPAAGINGNALRAVVLDGRRGESEGNDPESTGKFYGGADDQGLRAMFRGGADHGTSVVNRQRGPESELRL